jgi:hypothetical protein
MGKTPELKPENINRQCGNNGYRLYRVFEVYYEGNPKFSILFNTRDDANAIAQWHNDTKGFWQKLTTHDYKVRERRVHSGIRHAQTIHNTGLTRSDTGD